MPNLHHPLIWRVDWTIVQSGQFAVQNPEDLNSILYLTKKEFLKLTGIVESNDGKLTVLASPYDTKPKDEAIEAPNPENSPPHLGVGHAIFWRGMLSRITRSYRAFLNSGSKMFDTSKLPRLLGGLVKRWSLAVGQWSGLPTTTRGWFSDILIVIPHLNTVLKTQGTRGLVLRLKNSMLLIQQYVAGDPSPGHRFGHPVRTTHGLPKWLPLHSRSAIRQGSKKVLRFWLSILYIYKVIEMPYKLSDAVKTILTPALVVTPKVQSLMDSYREFLDTVFVPEILGGVLPIPKHEEGQFFTPVSAGPNGAPAVNKVAEDAAALTEQHLLSKKESDGGTASKSIIQKIISLAMSFDIPLEVYDITDLGNRTIEARNDNNDPGFKVKPPKRLLHSRVHILGEAAGKLRPVAIFDIFSQRVLKPLHDSLFTALKGIPQDGTHSQTNLMAWLKAQANTVWKGYTWSSLDISAATDSIPVQLYKILITSVYGGGSKAIAIAEEAIDLMVDRDFTVTFDKSTGAKESLLTSVPETVRYGRGQPMGCLGSFALLALWNNSWVQFAAWMVTGKVHTSYGVTGDDVVIAESNPDTPIGKMYLDLCQCFGIPISLTKSFISSRLFNFLSRTWFEGEEISPTSIKEDIHVRDSSSRVQRALRLLERDWWSGDGNGWLAKAMKYFLYPSEYLVACLHTRKGKLNGYGLRSVLSFLSPSSSITRAFGLSSVPVFGWLSAFAGSTALLARGDAVRKDAVLPPRFQSTSSYGILQELASLLLRQLIEKYQWNDDVSGSYLTFYSAQSSALQEPGVGRLFLPSEWDFHCYHLEDTRWLYPDITDGYTNEKLSQKLGELWWRPENIGAAIRRIIDWLQEIPTARDYTDVNYFSHQATLWNSTRQLGEREFNKHERTILSTLYLASQFCPEDIDFQLSQGFVNYLERKYLDKFLGYTVGDIH